MYKHIKNTIKGTLLPGTLLANISKYAYNEQKHENINQNKQTKTDKLGEYTSALLAGLYTTGIEILTYTPILNNLIIPTINSLGIETQSLETILNPNSELIQNITIPSILIRIGTYNLFTNLTQHSKNQNKNNKNQTNK